MENFNWFKFLFGQIFLDWVFVVCYMLFVSALTNFFFDKKIKFGTIFLCHILLALLMPWFIFFSAALIEIVFGVSNFDYIITSILTFEHYLDVFEINLILYTCLASIIYLYFYSNRLNQITVQKTELSRQLVDLNMKVLKSQLQPHFLFNSLNSIFIDLGS